MERTASTDERIAQLAQGMEGGFDRIEARFDRMEARVEAGFDRVDRDIREVRAVIFRFGGGFMVGLVGVILALIGVIGAVLATN
jgi:hypothetical protein